MASQTRIVRAFPWANLATCAGISWGLNYWHAIHTHTLGAKIAVPLAILAATGPVMSAAFQSHNVADPEDAGKFKRFLIFVVFGLGMVLSVQAQALAVEPIFGPWLCWAFPIAIDLSSFISLHTIMNRVPAKRAKHRASRPDIRTERPDIRSSQRPAMSAPDVRPAPTDVRPEKANVRPDIMADIETMSTRDRARLIVTQEPGITGAELGRRLGVDPRQGRRLLNEVAAELDAEAANESGHPQLRAVE